MLDPEPITYEDAVFAVARFIKDVRVFEIRHRGKAKKRKALMEFTIDEDDTCRDKLWVTLRARLSGQKEHTWYGWYRTWKDKEENLHAIPIEGAEQHRIPDNSDGSFPNDLSAIQTILGDVIEHGGDLEIENFHVHLKPSLDSHLPPILKVSFRVKGEQRDRLYTYHQTEKNELLRQKCSTRTGYID